MFFNSEYENIAQSIQMIAAEWSLEKLMMIEQNLVSIHTKRSAKKVWTTFGHIPIKTFYT